MIKTHIEKLSGEKLFDNFMSLKRWGLKGGLAILDQGVYSGSNFIFNVLLARWLSPDDYGAFSLAFAIYLFFSGFHNALILEPMSVLATSKYAGKLMDYVSGQVFIHFLLTVLAGVLVVCVGWIFMFYRSLNEFLISSIFGVGIFLGLMLLMWLARRTCYIVGRPGLALASSFVYSVILIVGAFVIHNQILSANAVAWYLLMGIASLMGSSATYLGLNMISFRRLDLNWISLLKEQLNFGKWIILAAFFNFAATQVQLFIAAMYLGLEQAGMLRALQNFMLPMLQVLAAISTLGLPSVAHDFGRQRFGDMQKKSFRVAGILVVFSVLYFAALYLFELPLERLFYSGKFSQFSSIIPLLGIIPLVTSVEIGYSMIVRALQRPVYHAVWTGVMALVAIFVGTWLTWWMGIAGAVYSLIIVAFASLSVNMWFYRKWFLPMLAEREAEL